MFSVLENSEKYCLNYNWIIYNYDTECYFSVNQNKYLGFYGSSILITVVSLEKKEYSKGINSLNHLIVWS